MQEPSFVKPGRLVREEYAIYPDRETAEGFPAMYLRGMLIALIGLAFCFYGTCWAEGYVSWILAPSTCFVSMEDYETSRVAAAVVVFPFAFLSARSIVNHVFPEKKA